MEYNEPQPFTKKHWYYAIDNYGLSRHAQSLLNVLFILKNRYNHVIKTQRRLAELCGYSHPIFLRAKNELKLYGLIKVGTQRTKRGYKIANRYKLVPFYIPKSQEKIQE